MPNIYRFLSYSSLEYEYLYSNEKKVINENNK